MKKTLTLTIATFTLLVGLSALAQSDKSAADKALEMDKRFPVGLTPQEATRQKALMRDNLKALQEIMNGLAKNDWKSVQLAASRLGHPDDDSGSVDSYDRNDTFGFRAMGKGFEQETNAVQKAADDRDLPAVLSALGKTLTYCMTCHEAYKQHPTAPGPSKKK